MTSPGRIRMCSSLMEVRLTFTICSLPPARTSECMVWRHVLSAPCSRRAVGAKASRGVDLDGPCPVRALAVATVVLNPKVVATVPVGLQRCAAA